MLIPPRDLAPLVRDEFARLHGRNPLAVARAAGRVNLIGEHVDYVGGRCLPVTIPYATWVAWAPREDDAVHLTSAAHEPFRGRREDRTTTWGRYVLGALRESSWSGGVDLHVESSVPVGSGLSSSAALICAVLRAVDERSNHDLMEPAIRAETVHVGAPTGGLDQSAVLLSEVGQALRLDFAGGRPVHLTWNPQQVGLQLLVVDTGVRHSNDDGAFARIRQLSESALAVPADELVDPVLVAHRRHVDGENARVDGVVDAVVRGDWRTVGRLFVESHASLRDDLRVSCPELDLVVSTAMATGALGARMTGGGFGGCALVLVPSEQTVAVQDSVTDAFKAAGLGRPTFLLGDAEGPATLVG